MGPCRPREDAGHRLKRPVPCRWGRLQRKSGVNAYRGTFARVRGAAGSVSAVALALALELALALVVEVTLAAVAALDRGFAAPFAFPAPVGAAPERPSKGASTAPV